MLTGKDSNGQKNGGGGTTLQRTKKNRGKNVHPHTHLPWLQVSLDAGGYTLVVRRDDLAAVSPVHLVAVVLLRVVRRGHHYSRARLRVGDPEGHERGSDGAPHEENTEPPRGEYRRGEVREPFGGEAVLMMFTAGKHVFVGAPVGTTVDMRKHLYVKNKPKSLLPPKVR